MRRYSEATPLKFFAIARPPARPDGILAKKPLPTVWDAFIPFGTIISVRRFGFGTGWLEKRMLWRLAQTVEP